MTNRPDLETTRLQAMWAAFQKVQHERREAWQRVHAGQAMAQHVMRIRKSLPPAAGGRGARLKHLADSTAERRAFEAALAINERAGHLANAIMTEPSTGPADLAVKLSLLREIYTEQGLNDWPDGALLAHQELDRPWFDIVIDEALHIQWLGHPGS